MRLLVHLQDARQAKVGQLRVISKAAVTLTEALYVVTEAVVSTNEVSLNIKKAGYDRARVRAGQNWHS